jgi:hypothetical protein
LDPLTLLGIAIAANLTSEWVKARVPQLFGAGLKNVDEERKFFPPATQQTIIVNVGDYISSIDSTLAREINNGHILSSDADGRLNEPIIQTILSKATRIGANSSDSLIHRNLAELVALALQSKSDSSSSAVVDIATEALNYLRPTHLRQLALIYFVKEAVPPVKIDEIATEADRIQMQGKLVAWIRSHFEVLNEVVLRYDDALLLDELGVVRFRHRTSGFSDASFDSSPTRDAIGRLFIPGEITPDPEPVRWLFGQFQTVGDAAALTANHFAVRLSGIALGYLTLCALLNQPPDLETLR